MKKTSAVLLLFLLASIRTGAENASPTTTPTTQITLGHSVVALNGPWKFHIGDNPQWADPNFDDSQWETVNLTAKAGSIDPERGPGGYSPGWTAKGHPGYAGFAWYRIRIHITEADAPLALLPPSNVDDAYQVFADGRLSGSFGDFDHPAPAIYNSHPLMLALPAAGARHGEDETDRTMVLAFRVYMAPRGLLFPLVGGMHAPPIVGLASGITAAYHVAWEHLYRVLSYALLTAILFFAFAFLVLMLYLFDRTETALLWPLGAYAVGALLYALIFFSFTTFVVNASQNIILSAFITPAFRCLLLMTWWAYCACRTEVGSAMRSVFGPYGYLWQGCSLNFCCLVKARRTGCLLSGT